MKALITGITGSDAFYLAHYLLAIGYEVHGTYRGYRRPDFNHSVYLHHMDLTDPLSVDLVVRRVKPDEVYNLAAQSFVPLSWTQPELTMQVSGYGPVHVFEAVGRHRPSAKVYQASSSEMFAPGIIERTSHHNATFLPDNPYGAAKLYAHNMAHAYRDAHSLYIACGISFNHTSIHHDEVFFPLKVVTYALKILAHQADHIPVGNLDAERDWGYGPEFVRGFHALLQQPYPLDMTFATGVKCTVREFAQATFAEAGLDFDAYAQYDPTFNRPLDRVNLWGDPSEAMRVLDWVPTVVGVDVGRRLLKDMLNSDQVSPSRGGYPDG